MGFRASSGGGSLRTQRFESLAFAGKSKHFDHRERKRNQSCAEKTKLSDCPFRHKYDAREIPLFA
ncbi:MAG: hypothetical protein DMG79_03150 [Acidobacteria bacterium]|nr:MAG: hypothetical protein DMG79_03150 [Acidobacteriota bacterium]